MLISITFIIVRLPKYFTLEIREAIEIVNWPTNLDGDLSYFLNFNLLRSCFLTTSKMITQNLVQKLSAVLTLFSSFDGVASVVIYMLK